MNEIKLNWDILFDMRVTCHDIHKNNEEGALLKNINDILIHRRDNGLDSPVELVQGILLLTLYFNRPLAQKWCVTFEESH